MWPGVICLTRGGVRSPSKCHFRGFHKECRRPSAILIPSCRGGGGQSTCWLRHPVLPVIRRCSSARRSEPLRFFPPGAQANRGAVEKFVRLVTNALGTGAAVELNAIGHTAVRHAFRAVCSYGDDVQLRLGWEDRIGVDGRDVDGDESANADAGPCWDRQMLRFTAQKEDSEQAPHNLTGGFFVERTTSVEHLADRLVRDLDRSGCFKAHCFRDASGALGALALGIATAPELGIGQPFHCKVGSLRLEGEARTRVVAQVFDNLHGRGAGTDFRAFPPGKNAKADEILRFERAVENRLGRGQPVAMECRGPDAVLFAVSALARLQGSVAEFRVAWAGAGAGVGRVLRLRTVRGELWDQFSATNFQRTRLLRVTSTTAALPLARAAGSEVKSRGAVALHAFADDTAAVNLALKALASVPRVHGGLRLACVPSFGQARLPERPGRPGMNVPVLRFFVRPCTGSPLPRLTAARTPRQEPAMTAQPRFGR